MVAVRIEDLFVKVIFGWLILAAMFTGPGRVNVFVDANSSNEHGFGDVNISAILNSFQMGYDKRVRPNYGGKFRVTGKIQIISIEPLQEQLFPRLA
jgi:hypothetical protein